MKSNVAQDVLITSALSQMSEGVIIAGKDGELLYFNDFAEKLHGVGLRNVEPGEYSQTYNLLRMTGEPYSFDELPLSRAVMHAETVEDARWCIVRPDNTKVIAVGTAKPVFSADGTQIGSVLTLRDDTEAFETRTKLEQALELQKTLLSELNHRVANNLSLLQSLLRFQARDANEVETKQVLETTQGRIRAIASVHEALYSVDSYANISIGPFIGQLIENIRDALASTVEVSLNFDQSETFNLPITEAVPIALIIAELMTNSIKYAFENDRGEISITLTESKGGRVVEYRDDGVGLESTISQNKKSGLGGNIMAALVQQLGGEAAYVPSSEGVHYKLEF